MSLVPFHLHKSNSDPRKRRLAVALTRDDGTACYSDQSAILRPDGDVYLPGKPGDTLSFGGALLRIDSISPDALEFTILSAFTPYEIATRTMTETF